MTSQALADHAAEWSCGCRKVAQPAASLEPRMRPSTDEARIKETKLRACRPCDGHLEVTSPSE
jgi:hypothetical protein